MGTSGYSNDSYKRQHCCCHKPIERDPRLKELAVRDGRLWARLDNGTGHYCSVRTNGNYVRVGCVDTDRNALKVIRQAIAKELRIQRENVKRLMARMHVEKQAAEKGTSGEKETSKEKRGPKLKKPRDAKRR